MIFEKKYEKCQVYFLDEKITDLVPLILKGKVEIFKEFKVTERNYVVGIEYNDKKYILKSPRNEHRIPQRQLLTLFKDGECLTTLKNINHLIENGFNEFAKPLLAIVKRKHGFIVESYLLMEHVEGREILKEEVKEVVEFAKRLHKFGHYHGDYNGSNFIMTNNGLKTFDTQGKKIDFLNFAKHYEVETFNRDLLMMKYKIDGEKEFGYDKTIGYYLAKFIKNLKNLTVISNLKKYKRKLRDKGWKI